MIPAGERRGIAAEQVPQQGDRLRGAADALHQLHTGGSEFRTAPAEAEADGHAARGKLVDHGDVLGEAHGIVERGDEHGGAEADAMRHRSHRGQHGH